MKDIRFGTYMVIRRAGGKYKRAHVFCTFDPSEKRAFIRWCRYNVERLRDLYGADKISVTFGGIGLGDVELEDKFWAKPIRWSSAKKTLNERIISYHLALESFGISSEELKIDPDGWKNTPNPDVMMNFSKFCSIEYRLSDQRITVRHCSTEDPDDGFTTVRDTFSLDRSEALVPVLLAASFTLRARRIMEKSTDER